MKVGVSEMVKMQIRFRGRRAEGVQPKFPQRAQRRARRVSGVEGGLGRKMKQRTLHAEKLGSAVIGGLCAAPQMSGGTGPRIAVIHKHTGTENQRSRLG